MAEEESPYIEEGEPKAEKETKPVDIDALMGKLEQFDVKDPAKLEGKLRNADNFADMQSQRDQFANEITQLRQEIQQSNQRPASAPSDEYMEDPGQPIDIESMIERGVGKYFDKRDKRQMDHQQKMGAYWTQITNDEDYHLVKDEFEESLKDPATVMKLQTGQIDPMGYYHKMVRNKYKGVTKETIELVKQMQGAGVAPVHVEQSARVPGHKTDERTPKNKKLDELRAKRDKSKMGLQHDDEIDAFIDGALGDL